MSDVTTTRSLPAVAVAICTYNRASSLAALVRALRSQDSPLPFDLVFVNNNSRDNTLAVLEQLAAERGAPLHVVTETRQGIVPARNRAVAECIDRYQYMLVMDDDEIPRPGWIAAALDALTTEDAECVGGRVDVRFPEGGRPRWLEDDLLGFLAQVDYGQKSFWIRTDSTPIWTANIAYRTELFKRGLCFDQRYNREGKAVGGGEDYAMFRRLLDLGTRLRYRADMVVEHHVEAWRMHRRYFLKLHYVAGAKKGQWELPEYSRTAFGVPPFLFLQAFRHIVSAVWMYIGHRPGALRQTMNASYALGMIAGVRKRRGSAA